MFKSFREWIRIPISEALLIGASGGVLGWYGSRFDPFSFSLFALVSAIAGPRFPHALVPISTMIHALLALAPRFSVYVISFLIWTVAWVSHHEFIHDLDYVDPKVLWLNNLYLMWIAFLPFPTGLLGHHPEQPVAVALYGSICAITCLSFLVMRWYASFPGRLMKKEIGGAKLRRDLRLALYSCLLYLAGMTAGFLFPRLGLFLYAAIPASYTISRLIDHKRGAAAR